MQMTRRALLAGASLGAVVAVAGCTTAQISTFEAQWTSIVDAVQAAVAAAAKYIPTVETIAATAASLFGPAWQAAVAAGTVVVNQIVATLTNVVNNLSPPAQARLQARLRGSSVSSPIVVGVTSTNVVVRGYRVSR